MAAIPLPIASYKLPSPQASSARLLNCFVEQTQPTNPKGPILLRRAPGISDFADVGTGPIRAATVMADVLYVVSGTEVYSIDSVGSGTLLTGSIPGSERLSIANNGADAVAVRPLLNTGYSWDTGTVTQITDTVYTTDFGGAIAVAFVDGYLCFAAPGGQTVFNTGVFALTFNALDFFQAEGESDFINGLIVDHRELIVPGTTSTEIWYNAQNLTGSPFSRSPNGLIELGVAAGLSLEKQDNSVFYLANDLSVRRLQGIRPLRVSQHGIEAQIQRLALNTDGFGMSYTQEGHLFYVLTFPSDGRTFVYDATTNEWHERESYGLNRWRPNWIIEAYGKQLACDSQSGKVGILDPDTHEEWGEPQRVELTFQSVYGEGQRATHQRFELEHNAGYGLTTGQGSSPLATLKMSDDGGETFRSMGLQSLGERGKYKTRTKWHRLGSSRDRVYQLEISDPIPLFVLNALLEAKGARL